MGLSSGAGREEEWKKVLEGLVKLLHSQQGQIESLLQERQLLQHRLQNTHHRWLSDVRSLEDDISKMKVKMWEEKSMRLLGTAKSQLLVSLARTDSLLSRQFLEYSKSDLAEFWSCFEYLAHKLSKQNENSGGKNKNDDKEKDGKDLGIAEQQHSKIIDEELIKLKREHDNLVAKNKSEVSALLSERDFIWNQFREMESKYNNIRRSADIEVEQANEKIAKLLNDMEQIQLSNNEKDEMIVKLKANIAKLEADTEERDRKVSRLTKEVDALKNSKGPITPVLGICTTRARTAGMEKQRTSRDRRLVPKEESSCSQTSSICKKPEKMESGSVKRTLAITIPDSDTPKLFSSRFKVPKLKNT